MKNEEKIKIEPWMIVMFVIAAVLLVSGTDPFGDIVDKQFGKENGFWFIFVFAIFLIIFPSIQKKAKSIERKDGLKFVKKHEIITSVSTRGAVNKINIPNYWFKEYILIKEHPKKIDFAFDAKMKKITVFFNNGLGQVSGSHEMAKQRIDSYAKTLQKNLKIGKIEAGDFVVLDTSDSWIAYSGNDEKLAIKKADYIYD